MTSVIPTVELDTTVSVNLFWKFNFGFNLVVKIIYLLTAYIIILYNYLNLLFVDLLWI